MASGLQPMQELFAVNVVKNGGDKVGARKEAGYSTAMSKASQGVDADKLFNHAKISLRISELKRAADKVAKKKFGISVEQRLKWLQEVANAGLTKHSDDGGKSENLAATTSAIKVMNEMLGVDEENAGTKPVKVFIGVQDAS